MRAISALGAIALAIALGACAATKSPERMADETTRAVYGDNYDGVVTDFDDSLKGEVSRAQIGALSDGMHNLGAYHGLTQSTSNQDAGRYDFIATFDKGTMLVQVRLDPSGKLAAYRITPAG